MVYFDQNTAKAVRDVSASPQLKVSFSPLLPCYPGRPSIIGFVNIGDTSNGVDILIKGSFVNSPGNRIAGLELRCRESGGKELRYRLKPRGVFLEDWSRGVYCEVPGFALPGKPADEGEDTKQRRYDRTFLVVFTPIGNMRQILDLSVEVTPRENREGSAEWHLLRMYGESKERFIEEYTKKYAGDPNVRKLKLEDFD